MDNVSARIIIAAEAGKSLKEISRVKKGLSDIRDERQKDLMLSQAKAKLELAEYKSMTAAQAAYAAELKKEAALKRLNFRKSRGADSEEIQTLMANVQTLNGEYLKLAQTESTANLAAHNAKLNYDNLNNSLNNLANNAKKASSHTKDLTGRIYASRAASRLFGLDIDNGMNPTLVKAGIIAAGAISTLKILTFAYNQFLEKTKYAAEDAGMNTAAIANANTFRKETRNNFSSYLSDLESINEKEKLTNVDKLNISKNIEKLSKKYGDLGIIIDNTSGKIKNFSEIQKKVSRNVIEEEKKDIQKEIDAYEKELESLRKITQRDTVIGSIFSAGRTTTEAKNAAAKMNEISAKMEKLNQRYKSLNEINVEKESDELSKAKKADEEEKWLEELKKKYEERRKEEEKRFEEQRKEKERHLKIQKDEQNKINKNFLDELNYYKNKIKYQKLLNEGRKKEAELLLFNESISKKGYSEAQKNKLISEFSKEYDLTNKKGDIYQNKIARSGENFTFKEIAQSLILANSVDALRLQSRVLTQSPEMKVQQSQLDTLKQIKNGIDRLIGPSRTAQTLVRS